MPQSPIRVLFVCHGNICRSTMAEFVLKDMVARRGLAEQFRIESAATSTEEIGNPVHPGTAAVLRAAEIGAEVILLAKNIDGVYNADPAKDANAIKYDAISYEDVLAQHLAVMDSTATSLSMDNHIPVLVFALKDPENIIRAVEGKKIGTIVGEN